MNAPMLHATSLLASLAWIGAWLHVARARSAAGRMCELAAGPWLPCGPYDWRTPLVLALAGALAAAAAAAVAARRRARLDRQPRASRQPGGGRDHRGSGYPKTP